MSRVNLIEGDFISWRELFSKFIIGFDFGGVFFVRILIDVIDAEEYIKFATVLAFVFELDFRLIDCKILG